LATGADLRFKAIDEIDYVEESAGRPPWRCRSWMSFTLRAKIASIALRVRDRSYSRRYAARKPESEEARVEARKKAESIATPAVGWQRSSIITGESNPNLQI
jgi:hypothetical protein